MLSQEVLLTSRAARIQHLRLMKKVDDCWPSLFPYLNPFWGYGIKLNAFDSEFTARERWWITWGGTALFDRLQAIAEVSPFRNAKTATPKRRQR